MGSILIKLHQLINYNQNENIHYSLAKYLLANCDTINRLSISNSLGSLKDECKLNVFKR